MAINTNLNNVGYGLNQPSYILAPYPIVGRRAPTVNDINYQIGQEWVFPASNAVYFLTSVVSNTATWTLSSSGGAGVFSSLTVTPGPISLTGTTTINTTGTASTSIGNATGTITLTGATSLTGAFTTSGGAVSINSGTAAFGLSTDASATTISIGTGAAVVKTISIGGTGANVIAIGNTQTAGSISLGAAMTTGTISIGSNLSGLVSVPFVSVTAAGSTVINNVRVGQAIYTGLTTASAATEVLTLTNSLISATSSIFLTVSNLGSNDAQMNVRRILPGAGTVAITLFNDGAAALNGNVQVSFWVN